MVTTIYVAHENLMNNQVERRMWMEFALAPVHTWDAEIYKGEASFINFPMLEIHKYNISA